ncbi:MAG TPA: ACT domain-containing protein [Phototrophicaceae bacterium]|nr:ACT domain-containing protein [Phototrophicaceae bacterium]
MAQTVEQALQQANLYTDEVLYSLIHLPPNGIMAAAGVIAELGEPFATLIVDKDEVTLIIPADAVADFAKRLRDHRVSELNYRLITFDLELEPTLTGFMARISATLASANVPILTLGAFSRDHLLVPADRFETAWDTLKQLQR